MRDLFATLPDDPAPPMQPGYLDTVLTRGRRSARRRRIGAAAVWAVVVLALAVLVLPGVPLPAQPGAPARKPGLPDHFAGYSLLTSTVTKAPPGRAIALYGYGNGELFNMFQPLVVGAGGTASPIEITMRDDTAEISGTVEGVTPPAQRPVISSVASLASGDARGSTFYAPLGGQAAAHIYCIPLADSSGQLAEIWVSPDGSFVSQGLAPGAYRLLAFDREQHELEYRNPEALRTYDSKGPVVRMVGGQKEHVQLQLISTSIAAGASENDQ